MSVTLTLVNLRFRCDAPQRLGARSGIGYRDDGALADWRPTVPLHIRSAETGDYAAIASIVGAEDTHDPPSPEQLYAGDAAAASHDASFRRLVAERDGHVIAVGAFHADQAGGAAARLWMTVHLREDSRGRGADAALLRAALAATGGDVMEIWTCVREDRLDPAGVVRQEGFEERFRSWGARIDPQRFDAARFAPLLRRLESDGVRLVRAVELEDVDSEERLVALQRRLEGDAIVEQPVIPQLLEDVTSADTIRESVMVAIARQAERDAFVDAYVGVASLLGAASRPTLTCGFVGVERPYRRRGIATALLAGVIAVARELGCRALDAGGGSADAAAMRLVHRLGFELTPAWITFARRR
jgi:GNAT superfamily N-acetyltransferase